MRILYICRLYSGFEESCRSGQWQPKGAPTIARMIETLDERDDIVLSPVFTCKDYNSGWTERGDVTLRLSPLRANFKILAGQNAIPAFFGRLREKISDLRQLLALWRAAQQFKPDLIYCDRVNLFPAAVFSRLSKTPVIWRVMGILPQMHETLDKNTWRACLARFLYRSPFAAVICTREGSGGGQWMKRALRPSVPTYEFLNGVSRDVKAELLPDFPPNVFKVLFVGRLESLKGAVEFLEGFALAHVQYPACHAIFAGDGALASDLKALAKERGLSASVSFLGSLNASQLKYVRDHSDIYVSLNKQGNLSNSNLEALADGLVSIVPASCPDTGIDTDTNTLIPPDVFYRFGKVGNAQALAEAILKFTNPSLRHEYHARTKALAEKILPCWSERIAQEMAVLKAIMERRAP